AVAAPADDAATSMPGETLQATAGAVYEDIMISDGQDVRSYAKNWLVAPPGWTFGGQMKFITANTSLFGANQRLRFADLAVLGLDTRITLGRRLELSGGLDVLAKQPDGGTEPIPQGGNLGLKVATSRTVALTASVSGGPTLGDGLWGSGGLGVVHRSHIEEFLAFQVGAGASTTVVHQADMENEWQADLVGSSELVFHTPRGEWAAWGGLGLALPAVHSEGITPSTRLDVEVGTVFSAVRDWDLFAEFILRDRGTTDMPGTTLPIADGGFDQKQVIIGITRRFTQRGSSLWAMAQ
ncbi:MAG TPA: hypothetical protein VHE35_29165, partial [Kofleriaceae bacterium]|nr:hypothetical protein [Kofleriaceae bacterium]